MPMDGGPIDFAPIDYSHLDKVSPIHIDLWARELAIEKLCGSWIAIRRNDRSVVDIQIEMPL